MAKIPPPHITSFFYVLAQTWPRALHFHGKYKDSRLKDLRYWVLHGLWINSEEAPNLLLFDYSASPPYEKPICSTLLHRLNVLMPSLIKDQANTRLKGLYNKHGKCVVHYNIESNGDILTPEAYLHKAVDLAEEYNIGQYMRKFHVNKKLKLMEISEAIQKEIKVTPNFNRLYDCETKEFVIDQIFLCFNEKFNLINCPNYRKSIDKSAEAWYVGCPHEELGEKCTDDECAFINATFPIPNLT